VYADVRFSGTVRWWVVRVMNTGPSPATDVRIDFYPPLPQIEDGVMSGTLPFWEVGTMPPGAKREHSLTWRDPNEPSFDRNEVWTFRISFNGLDDEPKKLEYQLRLGELENLFHERDQLAVIAEALSHIVPRPGRDELPDRSGSSRDEKSSVPGAAGGVKAVPQPVRPVVVDMHRRVNPELCLLWVPRVRGESSIQPCARLVDAESVRGEEPSDRAEPVSDRVVRPDGHEVVSAGLFDERGRARVDDDVRVAELLFRHPCADTL
jgi:hypothetical protein